MSDFTESWDKPQRRLDQDVRLTGEQPCVRIERTYGAPHVYPIARVHVSWTWVDPNDEDAPGEPFVTLHTADRHGRETIGKLFLDQLAHVPHWLEDIITRAMPRL